MVEMICSAISGDRPSPARVAAAGSHQRLSEDHQPRWYHDGWANHNCKYQMLVVRNSHGMKPEISIPLEKRKIISLTPGHIFMSLGKAATMASGDNDNYDWLFKQMDEVRQNKVDSSNDMASLSKSIGICESNPRSDEKSKNKEDCSEDVALLYNLCPISPVKPRFELNGFDRLCEPSGGMGSGDDDSFPASQNKPGIESIKLQAEVVADDSTDDDDCVILDGEPNTSVEAVVETGDDDILVTREKGEIACRDFPHPRNLCATFPFTSTPHVRHCVQCYCFVCDTRAPCSRWGTGNSTTNHCHATSEDKHWKAERSRAKKKGNYKPLRNVPALEIDGEENDDDDTRLIKALLHTPEVPMLGLGPPNSFASARGARSLGSMSIPHRQSFKRPGLVGASLNNTNNNMMNNNNRFGFGAQLPTDPSLNWRRALETPSIGIPNAYSVGTSAPLPGPGAVFRPTSNFAGSLAGPFQQLGSGSGLLLPSGPVLSGIGPGRGVGSRLFEIEAARGNRGGLLMDGVDGLGRAMNGGSGAFMSSREFGSAWIQWFLSRGGLRSSSRGMGSKFPATNFGGNDLGQ
ncbi:28 kDa ribonucleoprotein [Striga asiatica]|uniref:28 kDa ribonucleoprotein n=1 Tax=Striga asiatica TaxID=4170 RepID=A0A5A7Q642_STRAF|nr:28 kDa ribonucleoprotein [Striga asiatica]